MVKKSNAEVEAKLEAKAAEVKKAVEAKASEMKKETVAATKKTVDATKKAVEKTRKAVSSVKKDIKVNTTVEYFGKQAQEKDMVAAVKKVWTKSGKKVGDIKTIDLYIKPEDDAVYYVINGTESGSVAF